MGSRQQPLALGGQIAFSLVAVDMGSRFKVAAGVCGGHLGVGISSAVRCPSSASDITVEPVVSSDVPFPHPEMAIIRASASRDC